jgi:hypothetical protein
MRRRNVLMASLVKAARRSVRQLLRQPTAMLHSRRGDNGTADFHDGDRGPVPRPSAVGLR